MNLDNLESLGHNGFGDIGCKAVVLALEIVRREGVHLLVDCYYVILFVVIEIANREQSLPHVGRSL